jgi:hypothetical protein
MTFTALAILPSCDLSFWCLSSTAIPRIVETAKETLTNKWEKKAWPEWPYQNIIIKWHANLQTYFSSVIVHSGSLYEAQWWVKCSSKWFSHAIENWSIFLPPFVIARF